MNEELRRLMERLKKDPAWIVFPPAGAPEPSRDPRAPDVRVPDDVLSFYQWCGGMETNIRTDDDLDAQIAPAAGFNWAIKESSAALGTNMSVYIATTSFGPVTWLPRSGLTCIFLLIWHRNGMNVVTIPTCTFLVTKGGRRSLPTRF